MGPYFIFFFLIIEIALKNYIKTHAQNVLEQ